MTTASTTVPGGTDNQAFCYDEQDRLTWAGSTGTPPCQTLAAGTLTAANYSQSFAYDRLGRLSSGPLGAFTYDPSHLHAASAIGSAAYTAAYDAAGNMTCRAPSGSTTCAGTQTGALLGYNRAGALTTWQNTPNNPTATARFLYDGEGNRVEQQVTQGGTTTTTIYVGNLEQVAITGGTTTTTTFYYANGMRIAVAINGSVSYLSSDGLGSASVAIKSTDSSTSAALYGPYGQIRYSSGTMPTDYGFTGQHADATTGLDYYNARYYDPVAGQFTSPDGVLPGGGYSLWGLSRYAYAEGNPETWTDPLGHAVPNEETKCANTGVCPEKPTDPHSVYSDEISAAPKPMSPWEIAQGEMAYRMAYPSVADVINNPLGTALLWFYSGIPDDQKQAMAFAFGAETPAGIGTELRVEARVVGSEGSLGEDGASSALAFLGGLSANDTLGSVNGTAHVLSHVGLTDEQLAARGIDRASTFFDQATAESALAGVQATNQGAIQAWLASARVGARQDFRATFDTPIGRVLYADRQLIVNGYTAFALLRADPSSPLGYFIVTGYVER